ncbi:hypothetical protein GEMRC1_003872 [Eukaryota sp. GEM-RC1]
MIQNEHGRYRTPSVVAYTSDGIVVGEDALSLVKKPHSAHNVIHNSKRFIGKNFSDLSVPGDSLQADLDSFSFHVIEGPNDSILFQLDVDGQISTVSPIAVASEILKYLKRCAELYLNATVSDVVITVPASFGSIQRRDTREAAQRAGLNVLRMPAEPTAAAICWKERNPISEPDIDLLVYDLGGGTFDASLVNVLDGNISIQAVSGHPYLGGADFDNALAQHFLKKFCEDNELDGIPELQKSRLIEECRKVKHQLTEMMATSIEVDALYHGCDLEKIRITRAQFEKLINTSIDTSIAEVEKLLTRAHIEKQSLYKVLLVGGSTRVPAVHARLKNYFGNDQVFSPVQPDFAVAQGAAMLATKPVVDILPYDIGLRVNNTDVDCLFPRFTRFGSHCTKSYYTTYHNQETIDHHVVEGEIPSDRLGSVMGTKLLGQFPLSGIQPHPKGYQVEVTCSITENHGFECSSRDPLNPTNSASICIDLF